MSLLKLFFTEKCTNCGHRIEKAAKFCNHCQAGRANSWRNCTGCGASVAADSTGCWSCGANLTTQARDLIFSDRWRRTEGIFATRVTIETPQERLRHGIQVDEGTLGVLYRNGQYRNTLKPGYHSQTSFWERLTGGDKGSGFVDGFILVTDPVTCMVSLGDTAQLFTRDNSAVEAALLVKVQAADPSTIIRRLLPTGSDLVRDDDLILPHTARIAEVLRIALSRLTVEEVARSTDLRPQIEARLGEELPRLLEEYGLSFKGVVDLRLVSPQIERVRESEGLINSTERELRWAKQKRELEQGHKLTEIKDEFAFKEQVDRWTHEYALTSMEREHVIGMYQIAREKERQLADVERVGVVRLTAQEYELQERRKEELLRDELERLRLQREHDAERERIRLKKEGDMSDVEILNEVRRGQIETMRALSEIKTKAKIEVAQGTKDVSPIHVAGALGESVVEAIRASQPKPNVTVFSTGQSFATMPPGTFPGGQSVPSFVQNYAAGMATSGVAGSTFVSVGGPSFGGSGFEVHAQRYEPSVGICSMSLPGAGEPTPVGTAWLVAGRSCLVTNAHVAVTLLEAREKAGMSIWVTLAGQSTALPVGRILVHPNYALSKDRKDPLPTHDFAILHIDVPLPPGVQGLPLASRAKLMTLREMQSVGYLGFPFENLVGSVLLRSPKPTAQKGSISALQPWDFSHSSDPARCQLIKHNLGVAGGASGSPLFDESGDVIGVITAGNMERLYDPQSPAKPRRVPSGVQLNFAQRIDVLLDWMGW
jgi:hypothetical protein